MLRHLDAHDLFAERLEALAGVKPHDPPAAVGGLDRIVWAIDEDHLAALMAAAGGIRFLAHVLTGVGSFTVPNLSATRRLL